MSQFPNEKGNLRLIVLILTLRKTLEEIIQMLWGY